MSSLTKVFKFLSILFFTTSILAQDEIHLNFGDSIYAEVTTVSDKYVSYKLNTFFDSTEYSIKRRKVTHILYDNGQKKYFKDDFLIKRYVPGVYLIFGEKVGGLSNSGSETMNSGGIGHGGLIRLNNPRWSLLYEIDWRTGTFTYNTSDYTGYNTSYKGFNELNFNTGIEYRYHFQYGFAAYLNAMAGYSYIIFNEYNIFTTDKWPTVNISSGMYLRQWKAGIGYSYGNYLRNKDYSKASRNFPEANKFYTQTFLIKLAYYF